MTLSVNKNNVASLAQESAIQLIKAGTYKLNQLAGLLEVNNLKSQMAEVSVTNNTNGLTVGFFAMQPGVEFDNTKVHVFDAVASTELADFIAEDPQLVFEAHSTDFQPQSRYQQLVQQHFAILKVGPQLTFALREALFALCYIEQQLVPVEKVRPDSFQILGSVFLS